MGYFNDFDELNSERRIVPVRNVHNKNRNRGLRVLEVVEMEAIINSILENSCHLRIEIRLQTKKDVSLQ